MPENVTMGNQSPGRVHISAESMAIAAAIALYQRRARGEVMTYEQDGWIVREYPGMRIVRLAPVGQFRAEDHPVVP